MNRTNILRWTVWAVAVLAIGYASFAFLYWRLSEMLIAVGIFVICIPIDMALAQIQRERRLPPHGPVRKFGYREAGGNR